MGQAQAIVLGVLARREAYGYQIKKQLASEPLSEWIDLSSTALYEELDKMVDAGLLERVESKAAPARPARALYRISAQGRTLLLGMLRQAWVEPERAALSQDIAVLLLDVLPSAEVSALLSERASHLERELQSLEGRIDKAKRPGQLLLQAVLQRARLRVQAELDWTRDLLARAQTGEFAIVPATQKKARTQKSASRARGKGQGAFTFVLHSHIPYCRMAGQWPHGEEWLHEAAAETYVPLLDALYDLREQGVDYRLTIGLTPVLTEQLADRDVKEHLVQFLDAEIEAATEDMARFGEQGDEQRERLARYYREFYRQVKRSFLERFAGDMVGAFRRLQDEGYLEIITCAATHGYLPLLARDASIYAQLRAGVESYKRHFGRSPRAIWLPECAYRPAYFREDGSMRPGLEEFLADLGLTCFFVETHAIEGGRPVGKAGGQVAIGPYAAIERRYVIPSSDVAHTGGSTFCAYHVLSRDGRLTEPPVAVIGRNNRTGQQVWSAEWGYPGDADYREFHKKDDESGLQYWRITGPRVDLGAKDFYHPEWVEGKVQGHARHYAQLVEQLIREHHDASKQYGIIASNYDTELFGHWWFEGITWLREVLRELSHSEVVDVVTASEYVQNAPPAQAMAVPESSWGSGGTHWTWDNDDTRWMWQPIHEAEQRMEALVSRYPEPSDDERIVLNQAARELLLLQSSDWPFLVTTGQAKQYATERFLSHVGRFQELAQMAESAVGPEARRYAERLSEIDNVFPDIDYRWFAAR